VFVEQMMGSLIGSALGLRGKRHQRAHGFLAGGPSSFLNTSTLLTAAGVAATAYTLYRAYQTSTPASTSSVTGGPEPLRAAPPPAGAMSSASSPPLAAPRASSPPPLLVVPRAPQALATGPIAPAGPASSAAPVDALTRIVALTIAAARCDGELGEEEYGRILDTARAHQAESLVARELSEVRPLADLAAGVIDAQYKADLYVLAYGIVRADESLSSAERDWLASWAGLLGLDAATVARLEKDAAARIASTPPSPPA
jgi:uncharacterized membrane protein YebE (DUF533 family)